MGSNRFRKLLSLARRTVLALSFAALGFLLPCGIAGVAFGQTSVGDNAPGATGEMTRDDWYSRIAEAKERARRFRAEKRYLIERAPEDIERLASERALNDDSLRKGDIVSTPRGLMIFLGREGDDQSGNRFLPYQPDR